VLAAWLLGGVLAVCGALSYGALALRFPHSGGEYEYLRRTVHPLAGTAAGIVSMLAGFSAPIAASAHLLQVYGCRLLGLDAPDLPWAGTVAILLATWMHAGRVHVRRARAGPRRAAEAAARVRLPGLVGAPVRRAGDRRWHADGTPVARLRRDDAVDLPRLLGLERRRPTSLARSRTAACGAARDAARLHCS
jgi:hypothetical protein